VSAPAETFVPGPAPGADVSAEGFGTLPTPAAAAANPQVAVGSASGGQASSIALTFNLPSLTSDLKFGSNTVTPAPGELSSVGNSSATVTAVPLQLPRVENGRNAIAPAARSTIEALASYPVAVAVEAALGSLGDPVGNGPIARLLPVDGGNVERAIERLLHGLRRDNLAEETQSTRRIGFASATIAAAIAAMEFARRKARNRPKLLTAAVRGPLVYGDGPGVPGLPDRWASRRS
jgi:hypothetical protein